MISYGPRRVPGESLTADRGYRRSKADYNLQEEMSGQRPPQPYLFSRDEPNSTNASESASPPKGAFGETSKAILVLQGVKALARRRRVSSKTIHRKLKRAGLVASHVQDERRRALTVELLRSSVSFREIATRLGLSGPQSLTRLVRRLFAKTPSELRRTIEGSVPKR